MACNPPLNFVANGAPGSALPPPLDPNDVPNLTPSPTFSDTACTILGADLCAAMDPLSSIDLLPALADEVDALATAEDANLDGILLALDSIDQGAVQTASDTFSSDQGGIDNLVAGVDPAALPALGTLPLVTPNGQAAITFGGDPAYGGVAAAGAAQYDLHLALQGVGAGNIGTLEIEGLDGPNPPFTGAVGIALDTSQPGQTLVVTVGINPAEAGTFTATLTYSVQVTITGITGRIHLQKVFQVVVQ